MLSGVHYNTKISIYFKKFSIQAGNYGKKTLAEDTSNADVINKGEFNTITIKNIKPSAWTERAAGGCLFCLHFT